MWRETASASRPPETPPSEAPIPIRATTRFAVYGSKCSLIIDQKPEISTALAAPEGTIKSYLHRGRARLGKLLAKKGITDV